MGQALDPRRNSLNALRLAFACMVIISHAWPIGGFGADPALAGFSLGGFAVAGFFGISGYLITESRARKDLRPYLAARALRILPGLWAALLAVAFVGAPLASISRGGWSIRAATEYVLGNAALYQGQPVLGGTLNGQPLGDWNGSLWTLLYEVLCYLFVGAYFLASAIRRNPVPYLALAFVGSLVLGVANTSHVFVGHIALQQGSSVIPFFFAGALLWGIRNRLSVQPWLATVCAAIAMALVLGHQGALAALPLVYLVLWLGQALPEWTRRINSPNDISYGVYIYAFPVTQLLVIAGVADAGPAVLSTAAVAVTVPLAVASWFLVERPAKALRARVGGNSVGAPTSRIAGRMWAIPVRHRRVPARPVDGSSRQDGAA